MGIRAVIIFLLALIIGCDKDESIDPIDEQPTLPLISSINDINKIEIVTWNIERFPKTDDSDDYVKVIIEGLDADIFVLQEIANRDKFNNMMYEIDDYSYYLKSNSAGISLAFVYKNDVVTLNQSKTILQQYEEYFAGRPPSLANFEWVKNGITKELSVINVHYKCCGDDYITEERDDDGKLVPAYRRLKSSEVLEKYIFENLPDNNVIVAGDFNDVINEHDSSNVFLPFLSKPNNYQFVDISIANGDKSNWSWQGWKSSYSEIHFDHILINNNLFDEFGNSSTVEVLKLEEYFENGIAGYDDNVSDHRPVYFKFIP